MKKPLYFLMICPLLISGCNSSDDVSYLAQKQECIKYLPQVEEELEETRRFTGNNIPQPIIFYSPKLDTCIAAWTQSNRDIFRAFEIKDLLLNDHIYFKGLQKEQIEELSKQGLTGSEEFNAKIEELKQK